MWWDSCNYNYNTEGQIEEVDTDARYIHETNISFSYEGNRVKSVTTKEYSASDGKDIKIKTSFEYDSEDRLIRADKDDNYFDECYQEYSYNEYGVISSIHDYNYYYDLDEDESYGDDITIDIEYDEFGNVTRYGDEKYKNKYKDGLLTGRQNERYIYKQIKVDKEMVDKIQAQQWALLNFDLNKNLILNSGSYALFVI